MISKMQKDDYHIFSHTQNLDFSRWLISRRGPYLRKRRGPVE